MNRILQNSRGISLIEVLAVGFIGAASMVGLYKAYNMVFVRNFSVQSLATTAGELDLMLNRIEHSINSRNIYNDEIRPFSGSAWVGQLAVSDGASCSGSGVPMPCTNLTITQKKLSGGGTGYRKVTMTTGCQSDSYAKGVAGLPNLIPSLGPNPGSQICSAGQGVPRFEIKTLKDGTGPASGSNLRVESFPPPGATTRGVAVCFRVCPGLYPSHIVAPDPPTAYEPPTSIIIQAAGVYYAGNDTYRVVNRSKTIVLTNMSSTIALVPPGETLDELEAEESPTPTPTAPPPPPPPADPEY